MKHESEGFFVWYFASIVMSYHLRFPYCNIILCYTLNFTSLHFTLRTSSPCAISDRSRIVIRKSHCFHWMHPSYLAMKQHSSTETSVLLARVTSQRIALHYGMVFCKYCDVLPLKLDIPVLQHHSLLHLEFYKSSLY